MPISVPPLRGYPLQWLGTVMLALAAVIFVSVPNLLRARMSANDATMMSQYRNATTFATAEEPIRQTIRTGAIELVVLHPTDAAERLRNLVEAAGGYLVTSELRGGESAQNASLTVRIPEARFEQLRTEIERVGLRVEGEHFEAQDVTKQYVDQAARLRNLRAQETQYLGILRQAKTVKDTLEVSDKLNNVRGAIEQQQAEFDVLSKQVETVAITISLRAEAEAKVFGLNWRPLYQLKLAARQGLDSVGDYAATMASFFFYADGALVAGDDSTLRGCRVADFALGG